MKSPSAAILVGTFLLFVPGVVQQRLEAQSKTIRGWLSDESCARGRASSGTYTGTNPDCAKECVAKGKKIAFILPAEKQILVIDNQEIAKKNIGDYVEVTGTIEQKTKSLHIDSLKMLAEGRTMCDYPPSKH